MDGTVGGSHYCLLYLLRNLDKEKYNTITLFYQENLLVDKFNDVSNVIIFRGIRYIKSGNNLFKKVINFIRLIHFIKKCLLFLWENKIDLVHLNNTAAAGYDTWLIATKILGIPCVSHEREYMDYERFKNNNVLMFLINQYNSILCVSKTVQKNVSQYISNPRKTITIYDGLDIENYKQNIVKTREDIRAIFNIPENYILLGLAGNIKEWKGQSLLIDSLNIIKRNKITNFICLLIGSTAKNISDLKYKYTLEKKIYEYGLEKNIVFTGYRNDLPEIINSLDIQIHCSIKPEPFGMVVLEGMALGKIIVASKLGGPAEMIKNGFNGFLFDGKSASDLAQKLTFIIKNKKQASKVSENAYKCALKFNIKNNVKSIELVYKNILSK